MKSLPKQRMLLFLLFFSFIFVDISFCFALDVKGSITSSTRWTKGMSPIRIQGDVTVAKGATLTIEPGVKVIGLPKDVLQSGLDKSKVELIVFGKLIAQGTDVAPIVFTGSTIPGSWYGIRIQKAATFSAKHMQIYYANVGVINYGDTELSHVELKDCFVSGVMTVEGQCHIKYSKIHRSGNAVVYRKGKFSVSHTQIYRNSGIGISISGSGPGSIMLDKNTIAYNKSYGIYINKSYKLLVTLQNSIVVRNNGNKYTGYELYNRTGILPTCRNNLIWDTAGGFIHGQKCTNGVSSAPQFLDANKDNFNLMATSPVRKKATDGKDLGALPYAKIAKLVIVPLIAKVAMTKQVQFAAKALDSAGRILHGKVFAWKLLVGSGYISQTGEFTAVSRTRNYKSTIQVSSEGLRTNAQVQVFAKDTTRVTIRPAPIRVRQGQSIQLSYWASDKYGNESLPTKITWSAKSTAGSISSMGLFKATTKLGTYLSAVSIQADNAKHSVHVYVVPGPLKKLTITPKVASLLPGKSLQFTAKATDALGNVLTGLKLRWRVVKGGGTIDAVGRFTAGRQTGIFSDTIEVSYGSIKALATVVIKTPSPTVASVVISPKTATLRVGKSVLFRASAKDSKGKTVSGQRFTWRLTNGGGNLKISSGLQTQATFTAGTKLGSYFIEAATASRKAVAKILISAGKAPGIPVQSVPKNGLWVKSNMPALQVQNTTDPDGDKLSYFFEVSTTSNFAVKTASGSKAEQAKFTTWKVTKALTENKRYYWRARAYDGTLYGGWSKSWSFTVNAKNEPPTAPKLSSPSDGGQIASLQPYLEITNATDPEKQKLTYIFELSTTIQFTKVTRSPKIAEDPKGTTRWKMSSKLQNGVRYYWRAWAIDSQGLSGPKMKAASFRIMASNKPPSIPQPKRPKDGEVVKTRTPSFVIGNARDPEGRAVTLDIEVDTKKTFDSPQKLSRRALPQTAGSTTAWTFSQKLAENASYFWRVRASDGKTQSSWAFGGRFTINSQNDLPTAPRPKAPADKTTRSDSQVQLVVYNATDADGDRLTYHFQVSTDKRFASALKEKKGISEGAGSTTWRPSPLDRGKQYHWRARAYDGVSFGPWSVVFHFTIESLAHEKPEENTQAPDEKRELLEEKEVSDAGIKESTEREDASPGDVSVEVREEASPDTLDAHETVSTVDTEGKTSSSQTDRDEGESEITPHGCGCTSTPQRPSFFFLVLLFFIILQVRKHFSLRGQQD